MRTDQISNIYYFVESFIYDFLVCFDLSVEHLVLTNTNILGDFLRVYVYLYVCMCVR